MTAYMPSRTHKRTMLGWVTRMEKTGPSEGDHSAEVGHQGHQARDQSPDRRQRHLE